jgi:aerobic C4-dicarboxylate transport protein
MSALEADRQPPEMIVRGLPSAKIPSASEPFYRQLYVQVLMAVGLGAALGCAFPDFSIHLKPFGDAFIKAIKVVVAPIIFTAIALGIAKMRDIRHVANGGVKALIIGVIVGNVWQMGTGLNANPAAFDPKAVEAYAKVAKDSSLTDFLLSIVPPSFVEPFVKGDIMPVLFLAVPLGLD